MCIFPGAPEPTLAGVYWRDDYVWTRYPPAVEAAIRAALKPMHGSPRGVADYSSSTSGEAKRLPLGFLGGRAHYELELETMTQVKVEAGGYDGFRRPVKIVE